MSLAELPANVRLCTTKGAAEAIDAQVVKRRRMKDVNLISLSVLMHTDQLCVERLTGRRIG